MCFSSREPPSSIPRNLEMFLSSSFSQFLLHLSTSPWQDFQYWSSVVFKRLKFDFVAHCLKFPQWPLYKDKTPEHRLAELFIASVPDMPSLSVSVPSPFWGLACCSPIVSLSSLCLSLPLTWLICMGSSRLSLETSKFRKTLSSD